jgi:hypothetical protein
MANQPAQRFVDRAGQMLADFTLAVDGTQRAALAVDGGIAAVLFPTQASPASTGPLQQSNGGVVLDFGLTAKVFTMVLVEPTAPSTTHASVKLEGSLDGVNWYQLIAAVAATGTTPVATSTGQSFVQARYVRANVTVAASGGSPTLLVQVGANN